MTEPGKRRLLRLSSLVLFLWVGISLLACAHSPTSIEAIGPCPAWSEEAIQDLEHVIDTGCCGNLEAAIGRQLLYCEAVRIYVIK